MPIYLWLCEECGNRFEKLARTFDIQEVACPQCQSLNTARQLSVPFIRTGRRRDPTSESAAQDEAVDYFARRGDFDSAARQAEREGKSDADVKLIQEGMEWRD